MRCRGKVKSDGNTASPLTWYLLCQQSSSKQAAGVCPGWINSLCRQQTFIHIVNTCRGLPIFTVSAESLALPLPLAGCNSSKKAEQRLLNNRKHQLCSCNLCQYIGPKGMCNWGCSRTGLITCEATTFRLPCWTPWKQPSRVTDSLTCSKVSFANCLCCSVHAWMRTKAHRDIQRQCGPFCAKLLRELSLGHAVACAKCHFV